MVDSRFVGFRLRQPRDFLLLFSTSFVINCYFEKGVEFGLEIMSKQILACQIKEEILKTLDFDRSS